MLSMTLDLNKISLKNKAAWSLIQKGHTVGVFQLESELGKQWASRIRPRNINELSAVLALIRPACLESGMTEQYCRIKDGTEPPFKFNDTEVDKILNPTNGVLIYQEQLMKFGGEIAWSDLPHLERLVIVDKLRKGIGKKDVKLLSDLKSKFIKGCVKNGRSEELANKLFSMIENAGRYAFNDAHAKKYALISYKTAYLKANFPYEFYSVYLTYSRSRQKPKEEIRNLVNEARMLGISISGPEIVESNKEFMIKGSGKDKTIFFGLSHLKQVSGNDVEVISNSPECVKTFPGLMRMHFDKESFKKRLRSLAVESLIKCGACDSYGISRRVMLEIFTVIKSLTPKEIEFVMEKIKNSSLDTAESIINIIKECSKSRSTPKRKELVYSEADSIVITEKDTGTSKIGHERDIIGVEFTKIFEGQSHGTSLNCKECFRISKTSRGKVGQIAVDVGEIIQLVTKKGKNPGSEMCQLVVSDNSGSLRLACFPDKYKKYKDILVEGQKYMMKIQGTGSGWCVEDVKILR